MAILAVLLLALTLRVLAAVAWEARLPAGTEFSFGDSYSYWSLAGHIARGEPYVYAQSHVFRAPGYPLLLAPLWWIDAAPPVLCGRLLGAVFGTLAVTGVMVLAWTLFDGRTAVVAGLWSAFYPGAIGMSVFVLSEALFCPLMMSQLACWALACQDRGPTKGIGWSSAAGLCGGLATLVRPSWLLFTPFAAGIACLSGPGRGRQLTIGSVMVIALLAAQLPWWIRNYHVTGTLVLTTLETGASLYDGLSPEADGGSDMAFVDRFRAEQAAEDAAAPTVSPVPPEVRLDRRMRTASTDWAQEHPARVIELMGVKFQRMWSLWPHGEEFRGVLFQIVIATGYVPLLVCGLWAGIRFWRRGWPCRLCLMPAVYLTGLHVVFVSSIRYRQPALLVITVLAAGLVTAWQRRESTSSALADAEAC
jgi:4-amino-4-deoxy-L-arabinose transferase-like glycosyltransferase